MGRKAVAREIRNAIFNQAEEDGRVMHGDAMDRIIEQVLAKHGSDASPTWPYAGTYAVLCGEGNLIVEPGRIYYANPNEIGVLGKPE